MQVEILFLHTQKPGTLFSAHEEMSFVPLPGDLVKIEGQVNSYVVLNRRFYYAEGQVVRIDCIVEDPKGISKAAGERSW